MEPYTSMPRKASTLPMELTFGIILLLSFASVHSQIITPIYVNANLNELYHAEISYSVPMAYVFADPSGTGAIRITVTSVNATEADPILILVKRQRSVLTWQVPLILEDKFQYSTVSRIVCPMDTVNWVSKDLRSDPRFRIATGEQFSIEVITLALRNITFSLITEPFLEFEHEGTSNFLLNASPAAPQYVKYTMRDGADRVVIKLRSDPETGGNLCSFLSVQSARCPVGDLESRLRLDGRFQTVTKQGAIEVTREQFNGTFYIAVLVKPHDGDCEDRQEMFTILKSNGELMVNMSKLQTERLKTVNLTVTDSLQEGHYRYLVAIATPLAIILGFCFVSLLLLQSSLCEWTAVLTMNLDGVELPTKENTWALSRFLERSIRGHTIPSKWDPLNYRHCHPHHETLLETDTIIRDVDPADLEDPKAVIRKIRQKRERARVADITHVTTLQLHQTGKDYSYSLLTVSLFYSLPVWQLVMSHQGLLLVTGNEDICYYNFSCANRLGALSDFNHIISNAGYVLLGGLFLLMVRRRQAFTEKLRLQVPFIDDYGIPSQLGVLYGMGLALVMEGVMSACYHICPSHNNFQFDTSFMYLIAGLTILKLYHSRHPDILPKSYVAYLAFAIFIVIALIGVISQNLIYWILFSVIHGLFSILIGFQLFFVGSLELTTDKLVKHIKALKCSDFGFAGLQWSRLILPVLVTSLNLAFDVIGPILQPFDFATHLLFILQANLLLYAGYYGIMKIVKTDEQISRAACAYFLLALPAWLVGMYYFTQGLSNWALSAAGSREGNRECFIFDFYDEHDVWHMLSGFGLFFTFMMLFALDDDLATVSRDKIPVF